MMSRIFFVLAAGAALAACQPAVPNSGFAEDTAARDAALASSVPLPADVTATPLSADTYADGSAEATAAETTRILDATRPGGLGNDAATNSGVDPVFASPSNPPPAVVNSAGISNENNFDAVSGRRSIGDDAARLAANRAQYQVVRPEALPSRGDSGPNIVAYALSSNHEKGVSVYRRVGLNREAKYTRACAQYASPDQAQIAFLEAGGPERDRRGVDPDGDGYACTWDPTPFRRAARQG